MAGGSEKMSIILWFTLVNDLCSWLAAGGACGQVGRWLLAWAPEVHFVPEHGEGNQDDIGQVRA